MLEPREATTEQLSYVIHAMLLAHQTGILKAERSYGGFLEEGTIVFVNGQVVQASASQYRRADANVDQIKGAEALNRLSEWGHCRFIFLPASVEEISQMSRRLPSPGGGTVFPPPATSSSPTTPPPSQQFLDKRRLETNPLLPSVTRPLSAVTRQLPALNPSAPDGIPYRTQEGPTALQYIEQIKLSRTHRRLFLLIDGKRNAPDLAHLMGKSPEEVSRLLYDLEQAGLVRRME